MGSLERHYRCPKCKRSITVCFDPLVVRCRACAKVMKATEKEPLRR